MYIIKPNTKQDGGVSPLLIQKEFLQNRFSNYIIILQQQPTDLFSEIVLQGLLLNKIEKKQAVDYLLQSDPTKFAYQYAQHCLSFQFPPILKLIFLVSHHQFLEHSLNIVVKNQITKRELMTVPLNYSGDISVQELESIISAYPKFNQLASLYLRLNPKFDQFNNLFISQIKKSELFQKNVETLLNYLLECDDKQAITQILLSLNFYNDTIINLGILMSTDEMQQKEEQLYFEKWTSTKVFKKKIWYRFSVLVQQHLIRLENMEFIVQNLNFQYPLLIKALFSLVRRHTSNFIIENAASPDIIKYANYFLVFPDFFKVFFIDFAQFQDEDYNNLILKSLSVTLTHLEKTKTQQEVFNLKLFLCQFLLQCAQKMEDKTEINIYQFLQQLLIKDKHLILQFVSDLKLDQIEKAVKNIDCLHIVSADLNLLSEKVQNKEKLLKFCQTLQRKHKRELVDKILEQYSNEKVISISTNQIMAKKEDKLIVQLY